MPLAPSRPPASVISTLTTALLGWSQNQKGSVMKKGAKIESINIRRSRFGYTGIVYSYGTATRCDTRRTRSSPRNSFGKAGANSAGRSGRTTTRRTRSCKGTGRSRALVVHGFIFGVELCSSFGPQPGAGAVASAIGKWNLRRSWAGRDGGPWLRCRLSPSSKTWHRRWCCWLRRERVASIVVVLRRRSSLAESGCLCPLAPDWRTAIARPPERPPINRLSI